MTIPSATVDSGKRPGSDSHLPSTRSKVSSAQLPALETARDCFAGDAAIKLKTTAYLPMAPLERATNYSRRLLRSVFHNFFRRTVEALVGFVFRKEPKLGDDVPAPIKAQWENIDNAGTHGDVFARDLFADAMVVGHAAILVDFPDTSGLRADGLTLTREDEARAGVRPYWVPLKKEHLISWRTVVEHGRTLLAQLVVQETTIEPVGAFGEQEVTRYRVFHRQRMSPERVLVGFELLRVTERKEVVRDGFGLYPTQVEIPVSEVPTAGRVSLFASEPPLADVATLTVAHYQMWSDYANSIHKTNVPILFSRGFSLKSNDGSDVPIGPDDGVNAAKGGTDADMKYVTHDGAALASTKQALDDLKADIGALGLAMLAPQKRTAETLGAKRLDRQGEESLLAVSARGLEDGLERALGFHARYLGLPSGGSVSINRMFDATALDPQSVLAYVALVDTLGVPEEEVLEMLVRGGWLRDDLDKAVVADAMKGARAATADMKRVEAEIARETQPLPKAA